MKNDGSKPYPDPGKLMENNVASMTECTGLIQSLPSDEEYVEAYSEIYEIPDQGSMKQLQEEYEKEIKKKSKE